MRPSTDIIHGSTGVNRDADPLTTPIYETTTFVFESAAEVRAFNEGKSKKFLYSRYGNPTTVAVEQTIARVEGAETAMLFASGMAATSTALLALLESGDEVVCSAAIYGGTLHLLADLFPHYGITRASSSLDELRHARTRHRRSDQGALVRVADQPDAAVRRHRRDRRGVPGARSVISIIDNTFASPLNQQPIAMGVDIVMHSVTKYLNGHSDVTAGALAGPRAPDAGRRQDAQAARRHRRSAGRVRDRPRHQDAVGADGAAQRERDGGGALARGAEGDARRDGLLSRVSSRTRITRWRRSR